MTDGRAHTAATSPPPPRGVLVTRPEPGAAETAARLAEAGWEPVLAPGLVLAPAGRFARPARAQALLLPSRAAARALAPGWDIPVLAVGGGTAEEARRAGFRDVRAAEGEAASLARLAAETLDPTSGPLLLAVGEGYSAALAAALREQGFRVHRRVAYRASEASELPKAAAAAVRSGNLRAALFFSPRTAACSVRLLRAGGLGGDVRGTVAVAISPRVARALASLPWGEVRVAPRPDQDSLLETLGTP